MVDFHSHILPNVDDGAKSIEMSLAMLRQSFLQGVDAMISTSHFYADQEDPISFLKRRNQAFDKLNYAMLMSADVYPRVILGSEVLYFPGISNAKEMASLMIGKSKAILIEPTMEPWTDAMLDEIARMGENFDCTPVIAHVDRYMAYLNDNKLIDRVRERSMLVQVNAAYFLSPKTVKAAVKDLKKGNIHLIGSDCHNLDTRAPNLGMVRKITREHGVETEFNKLHKNAVNLLQGKKDSNG